MQYLVLMIMIMMIMVITNNSLWTASGIVSHGYGSIPINTIFRGWTSIYQLFWGSLGARVLTNSHIPTAIWPSNFPTKKNVNVSHPSRTRRPSFISWPARTSLFVRRKPQRQVWNWNRRWFFLRWTEKNIYIYIYTLCVLPPGIDMCLGKL